MNNIAWLQRWFLSLCNREWEHGEGVDIGTIDNPGWQVKISLSGTVHEGASFSEVRREGESDWIFCRVRKNFFEGNGGAENLDEIIGVFRAWVESQPGNARGADG